MEREVRRWLSETPPESDSRPIERFQLKGGLGKERKGLVRGVDKKERDRKRENKGAVDVGCSGSIKKKDPRSSYRRG